MCLIQLCSSTHLSRGTKPVNVSSFLHTQQYFPKERGKKTRIETTEQTRV